MSNQHRWSAALRRWCIAVKCWCVGFSRLGGNSAKAVLSAKAYTPTATPTPSAKAYTPTQMEEGSCEPLLTTLMSGALVGLLTTFLSISFAVLVFGKSVPEALAIGIGMALVSNVILHVGSAVASSGVGVVAHAQSLPPPIQATLVATLMTALPAAAAVDQRVSLAIVAVLFSAVVTGILLFLFGWYKLGRLVRFLPMPVISGFLASVGFALVLGGATTMVGGQVNEAGLAGYFQVTALGKWLPGLALAVVLWKGTARWKNAFVFPALLGTSVVLFYALCQARGIGFADLVRRGWLLGPFQEGNLWHPPQFFYSQLSVVDWMLILAQSDIIATIPLVCFIGGMLMLSAIEFSTGKEMEPNLELKTMGVSNLVSGAMGGGFMGYPSTTFTIMQRKLGATSRLAGLVSALVPILVLFAGTSILSFIPRFVVGGLLIYFGYQFIDHWVIKQFKNGSRSDSCIILGIVITSFVGGFVASVGVGVLASAVFFLIKYSQISVIRYASTGATLKSRVTRNTAHTDWLSAHADRISIFGLQGYLFFGTAHSLQQVIMARVADTSKPLPDSIILDFRHVTGVDSSVVQSFQRLHAQLDRKEITLIFAQMPHRYQELMHRGSFAAPLKGFAAYGSLDEALECQENHLLAKSGLPMHAAHALSEVFARSFANKGAVDLLLSYLERLEVSKGTTIIQQNTPAHDLFFVESGRVSTYLEHANGPPIRLQSTLEDAMVGEIGFYLDQLRTATVIADAASVVYRLSRKALSKMEQEHPVVALELHKLVAKQTARRVNHVSARFDGLSG